MAVLADRRPGNNKS